VYERAVEALAAKVTARFKNERRLGVSKVPSQGVSRFKLYQAKRQGNLRLAAGTDSCALPHIKLYTVPVATARARRFAYRLSGQGDMFMEAFSHEEQRAALLDACRVLETGPEPTFDRITRLAAQFFSTPIASITLVSRDRVF